MDARTVLIVDDDADLCDTLIDILQEEGYKPFAASTCAEGLLQARERQPMVALLDLKLPDGSGASLLSDLKRECPDCLCIVVTAFADLDSALASLQDGAFHYLQKPVRPQELLSTLDRVFQTIRLREEKRQAERALRKSESMLRDIFKGIPDLLTVHDRDHRIVFSNWRGSEHLAGQERGAGAPCYAAYFRREAPCEPCHAQEVFRTGQPQHREIADSGGGRILDVNLYPVFDELGNVVLVTEHIRDVTRRKQEEESRKRLEAKIQQAQKLESLGVLTGGIAHDFNNLLMGILGNAGLALLELAPESPARNSVQQIERASMRAADLIKQMLAYSGRGKFVVENLNLSRLVEEMAHLLEISISKKAVLKYNFADDLPLIEGDPTQLRQVVMNLITNASEALGDKSGIITVATGVMEANRAYLKDTYLDDNLPEGYYVCLEVCDTGSGMNAETKAKIFDPFFTTKFTGRGLGLAAVLGIVRGHGGAIQVYSEVGRGSVFKVLFPCAAGSAAASDASSSDRSGGEPSWRGEGTILVVDDEETVRTVAKMMLERFGFSVATAKDGAEAVEVFRALSDQIVCVLLDMTMPLLGGEETFRELQRIRPGVRVVLSSGYNEEEATTRFAGKGLAGFIQKPYQPEALIAKMRGALNGGQPSH